MEQDVKIVRMEKVAAISAFMAAFDEESNQQIADLFATAVFASELSGWDWESVIGLIEEQREMAEKFLDNL